MNQQRKKKTCARSDPETFEKNVVALLMPIPGKPA